MESNNRAAFKTTKCYFQLALVVFGTVQPKMICFFHSLGSVLVYIELYEFTHNRNEFDECGIVECVLH